MTKVAYVFPGQGSQSVGMGRDLYGSFSSVKAIFNQADEVLGFPLSRLCFEGPEDELRQTINAQPALVVAAYACLQAIREVVGDNLPAPAYVAGHSLGEYTALAVAGVLDFANTVYLARERGRLTHEAGQLRAGTMAAIIGLDETQLTEVCRQTNTWIANINCPGQIVISGAVENMAKAVDLTKAKGGRAILLQVSGAFHTPFMQPAFEGMADIVGKLAFKEPKITIVGNTAAQPLATTEAIKAELLKQLCNCIQWQRSIEYMIGEGVSTFIEIGPGKVLTGLTRRINRDVKTINIGDLSSVKNFTL